MTADGGNTFQQATRLGPIRFASKSSGPVAIGYMEAGETVEWYQVKAKGRSSKTVLFGLSASADINQTVEFYFKGAQGKGRGKRIATIAGGSTESRDLKPLAGTYFIKVSQNPGTVADAGYYEVSMTSYNYSTGASSKSSSKNSRAGSNKGKELFF